MVIVRYKRIAVVLHWLIATLMIGNVTLGLSVDFLPDPWIRSVIDTHKATGITLLGLVLLRLLWRATHSPPPWPARYANWERRGAAIAHVGMYALMLALPVSGWLHDSAWKDAATHPMRLFGLVPWPRISAISNLEPTLKETLHTLFGVWHRDFGYVLYAMVMLHVMAALKHQYLDGEPELQRMSL